jgi:uncharacterized protein YdeI (YjbR/CyaY-like superfamily)
VFRAQLQCWSACQDIFRHAVQLQVDGDSVVWMSSRVDRISFQLPYQSKRRMKITKTFHARNREEWRAWLKKNHDVETVVWLVFYKKQTGQPSIPYEDAVEEALCFGWIDSVIQRIDDKKYGRKFTPRKGDSKWSAPNKRRVAKMIREGKMTEAGFSKLNYSGVQDDYGRTPRRKAQELVVPPYFKRALLGNRKAWENFNKLAPSYRRSYILWIATAKTDETRDRRLREAVQLLAQNKKLGLR